MHIIQNMKSINRWLNVYQKMDMTLNCRFFVLVRLVVHKMKCWKCLKRFTNDKTYLKDVLKWCSLSGIIGSNYTWRHRVKKLLV